jgi:hypothetical protein
MRTAKRAAAYPGRSLRSRVVRRHVDLLRVNSALCPAGSLPVR